MKYKTVIDAERDEEVVIYAHSRSEDIERIESFVGSIGATLYGYKDREAVILLPDEVECFYSQGGRVLARVGGEELAVRERIYTIEERYGATLVRINQSCLVNVRKILRFETTIGGALVVVLRDGYRDYVSRRQIKYVKERLGLKK